jgi:transcriptional regulator with XRE-family HTH domain
VADDYQEELGRRLRSIRTMQGLTLADVEERSAGDWKAVVVGSYERGDRSVTVARLSELADFYGVPISHLLPGEDDHDRRERVTVDLVALEQAGPEFQTLLRYVRRIQQERGDYNGRMLTLRLDDLRTVATAEGNDAESLLDQLQTRELVLSRS